MVFINNELKAIYLHNVKCGGVYMRELLQKKYNFKEIIREQHHKYADFFDDERHIRWDEDTDKHTIRKMGKYRYLLSHQDVNPKNIKDYFKFIFVRNPYDKIISAYLYLKRIMGQSVEGNRTRNTFENPVFFVDFNAFVHNYRAVNNISYYHAFMPQYETMLDFAENINFQYIGRVENLDADFIEVLTILGVAEIKHINCVYYNKRGNTTSVSERDDIIAGMTAETFEFINTFFEKDFEIFGYVRYATLDEYKLAAGVRLPEPPRDDGALMKLNKELNLKAFNETLQNIIIDKYENIINILLDEIVGGGDCVLSLKEEVAVLYKENKDITEKNKEYMKTIKQMVFGLRQQNCRNVCEKCDVSFYNDLAFSSHNYFCLQKKYKVVETMSIK